VGSTLGTNLESWLRAGIVDHVKGLATIPMRRVYPRPSIGFYLDHRATYRNKQNLDLATFATLSDGCDLTLTFEYRH
jgi:hypothetical protein